ncbi:MAG: hypothetical protein LBQ75_01485 [Zoogloeaceae bacterium]|jgi:hypothetical protein|nr:hypothetical protein [Zoogloeaceae bacterium]
MTEKHIRKQPVSDHFGNVTKMVDIGSGAKYRRFLAPFLKGVPRQGRGFVGGGLTNRRRFHPPANPRRYAPPPLKRGLEVAASPLEKRAKLCHTP